MKHVNKIVSALDYEFASNDMILLDADVIFFVHSPLSGWNHKVVADYSAVFERALVAGSQLLTNEIIRERYVNVSMRMEYLVRDPGTVETFGAFCNSIVGRSAEDQAHEDFAQMCKTFDMHMCPLKRIESKDIIDEIKQGIAGIEKEIIVYNCKINSWKYITHDAKITHGGIEVLTANPGLLGTRCETCLHTDCR